jgi:hypothetical protein
MLFAMIEEFGLFIRIAENPSRSPATNLDSQSSGCTAKDQEPGGESAELSSITMLQS